MKIENIFLFLLVSSGLFITCKPKDKGFGGLHKLEGKVLMKDSISENNIVVEGADVYIGFESKPTELSYSFKTTTDKLGSFSVNNLFNKKQYDVLVIKRKRIRGYDLTYSLESIMSAGQSNVDLILKADQSIKTISGNVYIIGSTSKQEEPVTKAKVYIGYDAYPNSTKYLYAMETDENGQFISPYFNVSDSTKFKLVATYQRGGFTYLDSLTYMEFMHNNQKIVLNKNTSYGSVIGFIGLKGLLDEKPIHDAKIYVGLSTVPSAINYAYSANSDATGAFKLDNVYLKDSSTLVFLVQANVSVNGRNVTLQDTLDFASFKNQNTKVILSAQHSNISQISGHVWVQDTNSVDAFIPVDESKVWLGLYNATITSQYLYQTTPDGAGYFDTDFYKNSDLQNMQLLASGTLKGISMEVSSDYTAFVNNGRKLILLPKDGIGYIKLNVKDESNTAQPLVNWCVITSKRAFDSDSACSNSIQSGISNSKGFALIQGLQEGGKYYFKGYKSLNNGSLTFTDSMIVQKQPFIQKSVVLR